MMGGVPVLRIPKQEGDAPDARQRNQGVYHPADHGRLPAKQPGHQIQLKQPHRPPVEGADDDEGKGNLIQHIDNSLHRGRKAALGLGRRPQGSSGFQPLVWLRKNPFIRKLDNISIANFSFLPGAGVSPRLARAGGNW